MALESFVLAAASLATIGSQIGAGVQANSAARSEARTIREIGRVSAEDERRRGRKIAGAQRAAYGAAGVDLSQGTPLDVLRETAEVTELNALREQLSYDYYADRVRQEGRLALTQSILGAVSTGITAAAGYSSPLKETKAPKSKSFGAPRYTYT